MEGVITTRSFGMWVAMGLVSAATLSGSFGPTAAAAAPVAPVVQSQTGLAFGGTQVILTPTTRQSDSGSYASTGQLGRGRYAFELAVGESTCTHGAQIGLNGTGSLTRSDGAVVSGTVTGLESCTADPVSLALDLVLTHGTRDLVGARLEFTGTLALHIVPDGSVGTESFSFRGTSSATTRVGYSMLDTNGRTYAFGGIDHLGDAPTTHAVDLERTPTGNGSWIVNDAGQVYAFGDARYLGGADPSAFLAGQRVTSISATPTGKGYWLFTADGRALRFGDAQLFGDLHSMHLNGRIVGSIATPTGHGYYMVGADGGVFAFGDARFRGSMGNVRLNQPVVGLVPTPDNSGYWLVASDGGVFSFNAPFHGSTGALVLNQPVVTMVPYAGAYMMVAADGGIFNFSKGPFFGSEGGMHLPAPIVNGAAAG